MAASAPFDGGGSGRRYDERQVVPEHRVDVGARARERLGDARFRRVGWAGGNGRREQQHEHRDTIPDPGCSRGFRPEAREASEFFRLKAEATLNSSA